MDYLSGLYKRGKKTIDVNVFRKGQDPRKMLSKGSIDLHQAFKNSYAKEEDQANFGAKEGYLYDKDLSSSNQQVYYNPEKNHLLFSVAGTKSVKDIGTDAYLMAGKLKDTNRFKEAEETFGTAKKKYPSARTTAYGTSMGGSIVSKINADEIVTLNRAYELGGKSRSNEVNLRTHGDIVSIFGSGGKHNTTIAGSGGSIYKPETWLRSHGSDSIKGMGLRI
jgi:hypothetical protein